MYIDTVTLFNRKVESDGDKWRATVLHNVDLNADKGYIRQRYGENCTDNAKLHVAYSGAFKVGDYQWVNALAYQDLTSTEGYITFASGEDFDFFIEGEWDGDAVIDDADYTEGFYEYMHQRYESCFVVTSCARYSVIPHFEVFGR